MVAGAGGEPGWLSRLGRAARELGKGSVQHTNLERVSHLLSLLRLSLACLCRANAWAFDPWQADLGELDAVGEPEGRAGPSGTMCLRWLYRPPHLLQAPLQGPGSRLPGKPLRQMFPLRSDYSQLQHSPAAAMWGCAQLQPLRPVQMHPGGGGRLLLWERDSTELLSHIEKAPSPERPRFWDKRSPWHLTRVRRSEGWLLSLGKWQRWWDPQGCERSTEPNEPLSSEMWFP